MDTEDVPVKQMSWLAVLSQKSENDIAKHHQKNINLWLQIYPDFSKEGKEQRQWGSPKDVSSHKSRTLAPIFTNRASFFP